VIKVKTKKGVTIRVPKIADEPHLWRHLSEEHISLSVLFEKQRPEMYLRIILTKATIISLFSRKHARMYSTTEEKRACTFGKVRRHLKKPLMTPKVPVSCGRTWKKTYRQKKCCRYPSYSVSAGPMMRTSHSYKLSSSTRPAENPSTGFFCN
jgi:hypothetical protein